MIQNSGAWHWQVRLQVSRSAESDHPIATSGRVEWKVTQSPTEYSNGVVVFTDEQLATAFGLRTTAAPSHSRQLKNRYDGDCAVQGKFIVDGDHLNIPCPGTGQDGDPNISIMITDEIRKAVASLLS